MPTDRQILNAVASQMRGRLTKARPVSRTRSRKKRLKPNNAMGIQGIRRACYFLPDNDDIPLQTSALLVGMVVGHSLGTRELTEPQLKHMIEVAKR
jgi:hypothetical protein